MPLIRNTIFLISKSYSVVHKMLSLIGNEVWGLNRDTQLKATDSLNIHVNSAMLVANGWRQIAFWVPNPHIALLSISNNVIFFPQCCIGKIVKFFPLFSDSTLVSVVKAFISDFVIQGVDCLKLWFRNMHNLTFKHADKSVYENTVPKSRSITLNILPKKRQPIFSI